MFDPENVKRYTDNLMSFDPKSWPWDDNSLPWVRAADYDQLLQLYREAKEEADIHSTRL